MDDNTYEFCVFYSINTILIDANRKTIKIYFLSCRVK